LFVVLFRNWTYQKKHRKKLDLNSKKYLQFTKNTLNPLRFLRIKISTSKNKKTAPKLGAVLL